MDEHPTEWHRYTRKRRITNLVAIFIAVAIFVYSWQQLNVNYHFLATAPREVNDLLVRMIPPNWDYTPEVIDPLLETMYMAVIGTAIAVLISFPVALLGAHNTTPNVATYWIGKLIITVSRSINSIIWGILFVIMFGPGALAGVLALAFRSIGFCSKLLAEEIEEIDFDQVEAVRATGSSESRILIYGIFPQIKPALIGISTYRWDINVREASILGFVGAGGIGVPFMAAVNSFRWRTAMMILLGIIFLTIVSEVVSAWARGKTR